MHLAHRARDGMSRRAFLGATATVAAVAGSGGLAAPALAATGLSDRSFTTGALAASGTALPAPSPIGASVPSGITEPSFLENIHWLLPGPLGSSTPFIGIPGFGLDVDPSTMGDYHGYTTFAVASGEAIGSDGNTYDVEFDARVMSGRYVADDGVIRDGTFAFL